MSPAEATGGEPTPRHGGLRDAELRALDKRPEDILDFSVSCNPYGPHPEVVDAIRSAALDRYPDPTAAAARAVLGEHLHVDPSLLALGNGACELLWTLCRMLVSGGAVALIVEPTFSEFRAAFEHDGGAVVEWRASAEKDFCLDLDDIGRAIRAHRARVAYLCTPGTPTGASVPVADVCTLCAALPDVTFVLDESFLSLSDRTAEASVRLPDNVVRVRSMTKEHALAGLRVGYVLATRKTIAALERARASWTTSSMAQAAVVAACRVPGFVEDSRRRLLGDRAATAEMLQRLSLATVPSSANFLIARTTGARSLRTALLERHGILVRDCTSFGLPDWIRVAARPAADRKRLEAALRRELGQC